MKSPQQHLLRYFNGCSEEHLITWIKEIQKDALGRAADIARSCDLNRKPMDDVEVGHHGACVDIELKIQKEAESLT